MDEAQRQEFMKLLSELPIVGQEHLGSTVIDGLPCTLSIVRNAGEGRFAFSCNLAGVPADKEGRPTVRLCRLLMSYSRKFAPADEVTGSRDSLAGSVKIETRESKRE